MKRDTELKGRDFLSLADFTPAQITHMLDLADHLKKECAAGRPTPHLKGKTLGMIFQKSSTRTRVSFETGIYYLGGMALFLSTADLQMGRGEPIRDTARTLSRYLDGIMIRTFKHEDVVELAEYASVPVINGLTDDLHPCQALADMQTIREIKGKLAGLKLAFLGDGNNVANSLMIAGGKLGLHVAVGCSPKYEPPADKVALAASFAAQTGGRIEIVHDEEQAVKDADVLYTDVWASMGQEEEAKARIKSMQRYQLNAALLSKARPDAIVMHCLPAKRGQEITDEVMESPQSVVFDQAENRLHAQMAVMSLLMGD
ncbi:MAG: ornithine carbamoyltransferase [Clostridiales bacterium]|nr:ornithine carbamoyltransferase [Clostridiales bacterium]